MVRHGSRGDAAVPSRRDADPGNGAPSPSVSVRIPASAGAPTRNTPSPRGGADAGFVTEDHPYDYSLGESSPLARVYDLEGRVLFLGTTHATNTSFHLAEYRADIDLETTSHASAVRLDDDREWVEWEALAIDDGDFPDCGEAFERAHPDAFETGEVGVGDAKLLEQRPLVDFAVDWFEANRE